MQYCRSRGLLLALSLALPAVAGTDIEQSLSAGPMLAAFHYEESEQGERLNREDGVLGGLRLGCQGRVDSLVAGFEFSHFRGEVDYDGQTQAGSPATTVTDEQVSRAELYLGRRFNTGRPWHYDLFLTLGYRHWRRDIRDASSANGLLEIYTGTMAGAGIKAHYQFSRSSSILLRGQLARTIRPEVDVDFRNALDNRTLDLGTAPVIDVGVAWSYQLPGAHNLRLQTEYFYENWKFARSDVETLTRDGTPVGTVFQPGGGSRIHGLAVTLGKTIH